MAGLRDQMLKAGLINEKQLKQAQREQQKARRGPAKGSGDEAAQARQRAQAEKAERDRLLNQQRQEEAERKARVAQARQLIETQRVDPGTGDQPFHFTDEGKVKRLYLGESLRRQLARGSLGIVKLDGRYELVPRETLEKIQQRLPEAVVLLHPPRDPEGPAPEDPYAAYVVPDDLVW